MLVHQIGAFNSPVWFNCGLWHEYGIAGSGGNFCDATARRSVRPRDSYSRPQVSACFISRSTTILMSIFELATNEARVFKFGSGTAPISRAARAHGEALGRRHVVGA
jgi:ribonucleoside-diphosphate reductase alpha chain